MLGSILRSSFPMKDSLRRWCKPVWRNISSVLNPHLYRKYEMIKRNGINVALDVGACYGEFATQMRVFGFKQRIISFEPVSESFMRLQQLAKKDPNWECHQYALGSINAHKQIHILNCRQASSLLEPTDALQHHFGSQMAVEKHETVQIQRLDSVYRTLCKPTDAVFLKIDAQGYEKEIIEGAGDDLSSCVLIQLEVSLIPFYKGETTIAEMILYMEKKGYVPVSVEPGDYSRETLQEFQVDIIFGKASLFQPTA